ncbi:hypothetical protein BC567DRAFT_7584 [Phyllosticta citribraziliensis]
MYVAVGAQQLSINSSISTTSLFFPNDQTSSYYGHNEGPVSNCCNGGRLFCHCNQQGNGENYHRGAGARGPLFLRDRALLPARCYRYADAWKGDRIQSMTIAQVWQTLLASPVRYLVPHTKDRKLITLEKSFCNSYERHRVPRVLCRQWQDCGVLHCLCGMSSPSFPRIGLKSEAGYCRPFVHTSNLGGQTRVEQLVKRRRTHHGAQEEIVKTGTRTQIEHKGKSLVCTRHFLTS